MALGFAVLGPLMGGGGGTATQCFAAGAALCSTSLGTTFAVLEASGLADTRVGTVLGTAAMMDDVLGLVMVQIVSSLGGAAAATAGGGGNGDGDGNGDGQVRIDVGNTVLRPVLVSLAFAGAVPLACRFVLRPFVMPLIMRRAKIEGNDEDRVEGWWWSRWNNVLGSKHTAFLAQTALLIALVVSASFAGASVLLAAYLAGIVVSWWADSLGGSLQGESSREHEAESDVESSGLSGSLDETTVQTVDNSSNASATSQAPTSRESQQQQQQQEQEHQQQRPEHSALEVYETYYSQAAHRILKPLFFASIGFSIPISDMFSGDVAWRGVIYGILMAIGKMVCGLWLVRIPLSAGGFIGTLVSSVSSRYQALFSRFRRPRKSTNASPAKNRAPAEEIQLEPVSVATPRSVENETSGSNREVADSSRATVQQLVAPSLPSRDGGLGGNSMPAKPLSLYPAAIVSCAMVARGEIGFLISAVAESKGVFRRPSDNASEGASELFLVVTWAIVLCTIAGPICVGTLVRRVKKLEARAARAGERGTKNVLGVWGVQ
ncbi:uncharacterized protein F4812DRAFT_409889 [Daldinia caldariorum]|uniref:uncharacterized protein n=1 Tax=Daldinia caldariorum TaxID=326644 RepID=UPI0020079E31|nr:uncharacterized protein F4812DRAFT_409889 [Daldinia caldariorum]KAI1472685.1 hypothetical protein F4812DRAFT_409889 [Daldinia caldariorum]